MAESSLLLERYQQLYNLGSKTSLPQSNGRSFILPLVILNVFLELSLQTPFSFISIISNGHIIGFYLAQFFV